ncbi:MAG: MFS transporter [Legionella sp.]|nr:MAG: MFS transporter [Legionella sp.]
MKKAFIFITLAFLMSFATANAVLISPALPELAALFQVSVITMESTFIWFLAGYSLGQLFYSPLNNRFGRKPSLFVGLFLQILSTITALIAGHLDHFNLFVYSRFFLALGSGVGLMMTFTIVSEHFPKEQVQKVIAYLIPSFAIIPALAVLGSGYFTKYYGWSANFYLGILLGLLLILFCSFLPHSPKEKDLTALQFKKIMQTFTLQLQRHSLIIGALLMGCCVSFAYIFSSIVPFITANSFHFDSLDYALANGFAAGGLIVGSLISARLPENISPLKMIYWGVSIIALGALGTMIGEHLHYPAFHSYFVTLFLINLGSCFVLSYTSSLILAATNEKANASAVMNFINVGIITLILLFFSYLPFGAYLVGYTFVGLSLLMFALSSLLQADTE